MLTLHARWVLPITSAPIPNGSVSIDGERIAYAGPRDRAPRGASIDLGDAMLMPGLVNAHTHLELTSLRGLVEAADFRQWIVALITMRREALTISHLYGAACEGIAEGLRAGITTYADTCDSGVVMRAMRSMGVRGIMYQEVFGPDPAQCARSMEGLRNRIAEHRALETPLVSVGVSPHAPYSVSDALFAAASAYAREERLPLAIHIAESAAEDACVRDADGGFADALRARGIDVSSRGRTPIAMLGRNGALQPGTLLIHCVRIDGRDIADVAQHGCSVAHCPASNAKLGHGIAPIVELLEAGVPVGLGSDSMASNNRMDILEEARLAVLAQRARVGRGDALSATSALELATIVGARSLGLQREIGSIEVGKAADLAAFSLTGPTAGDSHDPAATAIFALTGRDATLAMVAGRILMRDGLLVEDDGAWKHDAAAGRASLDAWRGSQSSR